MTVICFDGITLAADKLTTSGNSKGTVTKIFRVGATLVGISGDLSVGMEMVEWFRNGALPEHYPDSNRDPNEGAGLVVVRADHTIWEYTSSPVPFQMEGPFNAFGCGNESAMVAMACGLDARSAVEMVCQYNIACGNGIDTLSLAPSIH